MWQAQAFSGALSFGASVPADHGTWCWASAGDPRSTAAPSVTAPKPCKTSRRSSSLMAYLPVGAAEGDGGDAGDQASTDGSLQDQCAKLAKAGSALGPDRDLGVVAAQHVLGGAAQDLDGGARDAIERRVGAAEEDEHGVEGDLAAHRSVLLSGGRRDPRRPPAWRDLRPVRLAPPCAGAHGGRVSPRSTAVESRKRAAEPPSMFAARP